MYDRIKGFRDFYPGEMSARRATIDVLEETAREYGFREIGTPALERAELWTDKSGDEIVDELYSFEDQGRPPRRDDARTDADRRPDGRRQATGVVEADQVGLDAAVLALRTGPAGPPARIYQTNVDIFGSSAPEADAEILAWAADALTGLGLTGDHFEFRISHRDILGGVLESYDADVDTEAAIRAVDKSGKISAVEYHDLLIDAGLSADQAGCRV